MKPVMIIGNGGHASVVTDVIKSLNNYYIMGYLDDVQKEYIRSDGLIYDAIAHIDRYKDNYFVIAIGDNQQRAAVYHRLGLDDQYFATIIHPTAIIASNVIIQAGCVVMAHAVIQTNTFIAKQCIINTKACVEHDNNIQSFTHIGPNATLAGNVHVGSECLLGASATVVPNTIIRNKVTVGAGSTVINDIQSNLTVVGSPARQRGDNK